VFGWLQADTVAAVWIAAAAIHREKNTVEAAAAAGLQPQQAAANKLMVTSTQSGDADEFTRPIAKRHADRTVETHGGKANPPIPPRTFFKSTTYDLLRQPRRSLSLSRTSRAGAATTRAGDRDHSRSHRRAE
jgi:hypothetical protein